MKRGRIITGALDSCGINDKLDVMTVHLDDGRSHSSGKPLRQIITLRILCGEAVSDLVVLDDPAVSAMFGWSDRAKSPGTEGKSNTKERVVDILALLPISCSHYARVECKSTVVINC